MAVSQYFNHIGQTNEQELIDDLVIEVIKLRGLDLIYIPREATVDKDFLFGEDPENSFAEGHTIEMICNHLQGFEGEGDFMAGFGLDIRDEASFTVSKTRFKEEVVNKTALIRPQEGDLIVFPTAKAIFEITFVEHEKPFYQIGSGHTFDLSCKRFEWSHEDFADEGNDILDQVPTFVDPSDNEDIQDESDTIINFDEKDPFSENNY